MGQLARIDAPRCAWIPGWIEVDPALDRAGLKADRARSKTERELERTRERDLKRTREREKELERKRKRMEEG